MPEASNTNSFHPIYRALGFWLGKVDFKIVTALIIVVAVLISLGLYALVHLFIIEIIVPNEPVTPLRSGAIEVVLITACTASPIVIFCMQLVRQLQVSRAKQKEATAAAMAASEAKSSFLANMSHEIRTPLNGVLGMADALTYEELTAQQADCVATIRESGKALMTILNDILDLSKIEAGKFVLSPVDSNLYHVFESIMKLFSPTAAEKGIEFSIQIDRSVPQRLCFDTVRLRQCMTNLLSNALKFTEKGEVTVSVSCCRVDNGRLMIFVAVKDTGIGMNPDSVNRLFNDFHQADNTTSRRFGGTGLGISIARKLARLMEGDLTVTTAEGQGATFTFTFVTDMVEAPEVQSLPEGQEVKWSGTITLMGGARVLLADDNAMNRQVIRMLLKPGKMIITEVENGKQALEALEREPFDLVLMDVHMPVMDGMRALAHIRSSDRPWRDIGVIALTADVMQETQDRLIEVGMDGFATKPVDQRSLISEIMRVLSIKRPAQMRAAEQKRA